jgi:hypothetical protein
MRCVEFLRLFFLEFQILESEYQFLNFSTAEFEKKIQPESLESKTESEFRFRWGSQKLEPKIGIPNLDVIVTRAMMPAQQQQGCLHIDNGNGAIVMRGAITIATVAKMPVH